MKKFYHDWPENVYFDEWEFSCPCCGLTPMQNTTIVMFTRARHLSCIAYNVNSGFRCRSYNTLKKNSPTTSHLKGFAGDIECLNDSDRALILCGLILAGFRRIGIGKDFIHADNDPNKPNAFWLY